MVSGNDFVVLSWRRSVAVQETVALPSGNSDPAAGLHETGRGSSFQSVPLALNAHSTLRLSRNVLGNVELRGRGRIGAGGGSEKQEPGGKYAGERAGPAQADSLPIRNLGVNLSVCVARRSNGEHGAAPPPVTRHHLLCW
jgi:hypothetical protein